MLSLSTRERTEFKHCQGTCEKCLPGVCDEIVDELQRKQTTQQDQSSANKLSCG